MKIKHLIMIVVSLGIFCQNGIAQISTSGTPKSYQVTAKGSVPLFRTESVDHARLLAEDEEEEKQGVPQRFGFPFDVDYSLNNSGLWQTLSDGTKIWRLKIESPGAYSINLVYDDFWLPEKVNLYIYNEDRSMLIGAFTSANNKEHRKFATGPVKGDAIILELNVPSDVSYPGQISISRVVHAYRDIFEKADFRSSGNCNNNVNCPEGAPWGNEINSVAMVILGNGTRWCSGSMINNVRQDLTPYFLTAEHCLLNPETFIIMYNYQSPDCTDIDGPTTMTVQGTTLLASNTFSDFALLLLDEAPPDDFNIYYAGWSMIDTPAPTSVAIHHPSGDIKKISFNYDPLTSTSYGSTSSGDNSHWRVDDWEDGTTEGGSSGSPLFNPDHSIVGQLHGGTASCTSITNDWYGKFSQSWSHGSTASSRLKDWLDPDNTGTLVLAGIDANGITFTADTNVGSIPLPVNFTATSKIPIDSWVWDLGDGDSAYVQSPSHIYDIPGLYDVKLEIESGDISLSLLKENYIVAHADTIIGNDTTGAIESTVVFSIKARNNIPLRKIILPIEFTGDLPLRFDSFNTDGCRTDYFDYAEYSHYDTYNNRVTVLMEITEIFLPSLEPGYGDMLKVYFTIRSHAELDQTTTVDLDGYSAGLYDYFPTFGLNNISYNPVIEPGSITAIYMGCCIGIRGNIDNDPADEIIIDDLVYFVEYQFIVPPGPAPECFEEADVDGSGEIDVGDIVYMVEYMFIQPSGPPPIDCP